MKQGLLRLNRINAYDERVWGVAVAELVFVDFCLNGGEALLKILLVLHKAKFLQHCTETAALRRLVSELSIVVVVLLLKVIELAPKLQTAWFDDSEIAIDMNAWKTAFRFGGVIGEARESGLVFGRLKTADSDYALAGIVGVFLGYSQAIQISQKNCVRHCARNVHYNRTNVLNLCLALKFGNEVLALVSDEAREEHREN